ncbi:arsenate reductase (glutaredoxin) [Aquimarina sp. 2-A2]|uniref:Arsenate reductase n=1 Tax=Aquimarina intermedia TaxID=350814 RepID=A0A5S5BVK8_9FLAO|nr:arsenate reductase (glutaredoxin) [Aquimarina intermedia]TYP70346.1 arsenate reductase [Aquimarina intermedia]
MYTIYHNPRCSKSRATLTILQEEQTAPVEIIKYLDQKLTKKEMQALLTKLQMAPHELVRKNEAVWKENYKDKQLTDDELISILIEHPKLIERPIVTKDSQGVIGRPPENVKKLF